MVNSMITQNDVTKEVNAAYAEMEQIIDRTSSTGTYWINDQYLIYGYLEDSNGEDDMWIHLSVERDGNTYYETDTEDGISKAGLINALEECLKWFYGKL